MASTWSTDAQGRWGQSLSRDRSVEPLSGKQPCYFSRPVFIEAAPLVETLTEGKIIAINAGTPELIAYAATCDVPGLV